MSRPASVAGQDEGHGSGDGGCDQPRDLTDLLISAHDRVLLGNRSVSVWLPGDENRVVHLEQTFTGHAMKSSSCLFALKLIVVYQRHYVTHANLLFPVRHQAKRTFRSIVLITESIRPESTCLAMLKVKPFAVWNCTSDGRERAKGSKTASTTTGPSLYARASVRASLTLPGSSRRIPLAPIASATRAKFGVLNSTPNGTKPASSCSTLTKPSDSLFRMI